ncbi:MAG: hypothetical protein CME70_21570 [Halobacteriovorax sp.]|nr:hypothetical protein [Halobacteriovorax sp.]|tara:strand:+ start:17865 stop:18593 length:729 start_codon:yes stop_codon:yes gene_type:complete
MTSRLKKELIYLKRFLLNIFSPERVFKVSVQDCIAETGHSYGPNGNHFFTKALQAGDSKEELKGYLREYYKKFLVKSFNEFVNEDIGKPEGKLYFLPWEKDRIRELERFKGSHKAGPTNEADLEIIVDRLVNILNIVRTKGFKQKSIKDGIIRVQKLVNKDGKSKFIIRDGQHRLAIASYLEIKEVFVTYESVYYFRDKEESIILEKSVDSWPKVKSGLISREQALKYFNKVFNTTVGNENC